MLVNSIVLSLATAALVSVLPTAHAAQYWGTLTHPAVLSVATWDELNTPYGFSYLSVGGDSAMIIHFNDALGYFSVPAISTAGADADGRLRFVNKSGVSTYYGTSSSCNNNVAGTWSLKLDDNIRLYIQSSCGTISFDNGVLADVFPYWAFEHIHGTKFNPTWDTRNYTAGKGTYVYYLDAGSMVSYYPLIAKFASNASMLTADVSSTHAYGIVNLAQKYYTGGISNGINYGIIKITDGYGSQNVVAEPSIIKAFKFIFTTHTVPVGTIQRVIHTSHSFTDGNSAVVDCAIQWAFKQGVYVLQPSGNNNVLRNTRNPYVLTIGAYNKPGATGKSDTYEKTVYGTTVDLWAPSSQITKALLGTSMATGFATAAIANAISYWPNQLKNAPNKGYKYMIDLANTTLINSADAKVVASSRAGTKSLSTQRLKTLVPSGLDYFSTTTAPDYCGPLGLNANTPNWDGLIAKANPNRFGGLVYDVTWTVVSGKNGFTRYT